MAGFFSRPKTVLPDSTITHNSLVSSFFSLVVSALKHTLWILTDHNHLHK